MPSTGALLHQADRSSRCRPRTPTSEPRASGPRLPLRRRHATLPHDAEALCLRQGRRRLRLHVRVLHHPDTAWLVPQPVGRLDRPRGPRARRAGGSRVAAHLPGHHVFRHRSGRAWRARTAPPRAERNRRAGLDPAALSLSDDHHRRCARGDGRVRQGVPIHRSSAPARFGRGPQTHEAPGQPADLRHAARAHPRPSTRT